MKIATIAVAAAALVGVAAPAGASQLFCLVTSANGSSTTYEIASYNAETLQEISVNRDGARLIHPSDARPLWKVREANGGIAVTYLSDPSYELVSFGPSSVSGVLSVRQAHLMRNGNVVASGTCGMPVKDLRRSAPAATTGGRRVQAF